jgi:pSer/pThr/pTyr-binding forkhead associated (FHA) protein
VANIFSITEQGIIMKKWAIMLQDKIIKQFDVEEGQRLIIGRGDDAEIRIDNTAISRHHSAIEIQNGKPFLQDLCSLNGTLVNGKKIDFIQIFEGDDILIGKFNLVWSSTLEGKEIMSSASMSMDIEDATIFTSGKPAEIPSEKKYQLQVVRGKCEPQTLPIAGRTSIKLGKAPNSDMLTPGFLVSANQCYINRKDNSYSIIPQSGWRKTLLNGEVITQKTELHPGDEITIAGNTIRFELI